MNGNQISGVLSDRSAEILLLTVIGLTLLVAGLAEQNLGQLLLMRKILIVICCRTPNTDNLPHCTVQ